MDPEPFSALFPTGLPDDVLDVLSDALVAVDDKARIRWVNSAAERLFGYDRQELIGHGIRHLVPRWDASTSSDRQAARLQETSAVSRDGEEVLVEVRQAPDRTAVVVARTLVWGGNGKVEHLRADNRRLEQIVASCLEEIDSTQAAADTFVANVVHEIHGLVRTMQGFSSIVLEDFEADLPEDAGRLLQRIVNASDQLVDHLESLRRLEQIGRQPLRRGAVDMTRAAERAGREATARSERPIEVLVRPLPAAWGDPDLLQEVWRESLANAVKFTREVPSPRIEVGWSEDEGAYFVRDNGIGFDPRQASRIYEVFQRLNPSDEYEGRGIGLTIVQEVVRRHGGRAWSESASAGGATFYFQVEQPAPGRRPQAEGDSRTVRHD